MNDSIFSRNNLFFSQEEQKLIRAASVFVAGVGGLGCVVSEILTRTGVGKLILVDNGTIDKPDLGRQILYTIDDLDKNKVDVAYKKLKNINNFTKIERFNIDIQDKKNITYIVNNTKIVGFADCLDNYNSRFALEDYLHEEQFLVHGGIERDFGQVTTIMKNKTQKLKDIYANQNDNDNIIAVSPSTVFVVASLMAHEIINNILNKPMLLNKMLVAELTDFHFRNINL